jgi:hypothetical protein
MSPMMVVGGELSLTRILVPFSDLLPVTFADAHWTPQAFPLLNNTLQFPQLAAISSLRLANFLPPLEGSFNISRFALLGCFPVQKPPHWLKPMPLQAEYFTSPRLAAGS